MRLAAIVAAILGALLIVAGVALVHFPAGLIVAGILLIAAGYVGAYVEANHASS